jgi:hypothetical protein
MRGILGVRLRKGSSVEDHLAVFGVLSDLGYGGQYAPGEAVLGPAISVRVRNTLLHREPTAEQIRALRSLPAVRQVMTVD